MLVDLRPRVLRHDMPLTSFFVRCFLDLFKKSSHLNDSLHEMYNQIFNLDEKVVLTLVFLKTCCVGPNFMGP
jgi:hypothetical protein